MQIGNEINDGLLWPTGQISVNGFTGASQLLHAGSLAVRTASPSTKTVIHLANGWDQADVSWFYSGIFNVSETGEGLGCGLTHSDVDVMGFSFYPFYGTNATLSNLDSSMEYVISTYNKVGGVAFIRQTNVLIIVYRILWLLKLIGLQCVTRQKHRLVNQLYLPTLRGKSYGQRTFLPFSTM